MKTRWIRNEEVDGPGLFVPKSLEELTLVHPHGSLGHSGHSHTVVEAGSLSPQQWLPVGGDFVPSHTGDIWQCLEPVLGCHNSRVLMVLGR